MNEAYVMGTIRDYIEETESHMSACLSIKPVFDNLSYSCWAANEILNRVIDEVCKLPPHITGYLPKSHIEVVEEFIEDMEYLYETCTDEKKRSIFAIARCTGEEILSLF